MNFLLALHGVTGVTLLCLLLFLEEAGIPMPLLPGDGILIVAGILVANDSFPLWLFLPLACLAVLGGALTGYTWTRLLGAQGLVALASRLHAAAALQRVQERLAGAGPMTIAVCRLIPGLRVNTTLVSGAIGVEMRSFLLGVIPTIAAWVVSFTLLGMLVGLPAQHFLGRVGKLATDGIILLLVGVAGYLALRHIPPVEHGNNAIHHAPRPGRLVLALIVDLAIVSCIALGLASLVRAGIGVGDVDGFADVAAIVAVGVLGYVLVSRRGTGLTGGEALAGISYRRGRSDDPTDHPPGVTAVT